MGDGDRGRGAVCEGGVTGEVASEDNGDEERANGNGGGEDDEKSKPKSLASRR